MIKQYPHYVLVQDAIGNRQCVTNAEIYTEMMEKREKNEQFRLLADADGKVIGAAVKKREGEPSRPGKGEKMNILSYYRGEAREIKKGEKYYLGQLWDGNGDLENLIWNSHNASSCVGDDKDGMPVIVEFCFDDVDCENPMNTIVTVTDIY